MQATHRHGLKKDEEAEGNDVLITEGQQGPEVQIRLFEAKRLIYWWEGGEIATELDREGA